MEIDESVLSAVVGSSCYWSGWSCGELSCANGFALSGVDFNANRSEGCWGAGNDYDEPFRRVHCCTSPPVTDACEWTGWGCGQIGCGAGYIASGVDFNINRSEGCWGAGNDYDEPRRRVRCCQAKTNPSGQCYWLPWACGEMLCPPGAYVATIDFNTNRSEGCWGAGNDYDEPQRRLYCCNP